MNNTLKYASLAAFIGAVGVAHADPAETKGGIKIRTEDGRFEVNVNGRIQFDYYFFSQDDDATIGAANTGFGSNQRTAGVQNFDNRGGAAFRRAYLTIAGKAYGWDYKFENDFARAGTADGRTFREMWLATQVGPGRLIIGQNKPFRSMEELASSNEITLMERPVTSATGIYANRQYLTGLFYKGIVADQLGYGVWATTLGDATQITEGHSFGGRVYYYPFAEDGKVLHASIGYSHDREDAGSAAAAPAFSYGGRRGVPLVFGNAGSSDPSGFGAQQTIHGELAGSLGSFTLQGEYAYATLEDARGPATDKEDTDVIAWYVQGSYFATGEKKVYKKDRGAYGSPKPINPYGAIELVARYEYMENNDTDNGVANGCALAGVAAANFRECKVDQVTVGANWYVNPNVRMMVNYYLPMADVGSGKDEPDAVSLRAQFAF